MANRNTKRNRKLAEKEGKHFHGKPCITDWARRSENPMNKRKSPHNYSQVVRRAAMVES